MGSPILPCKVLFPPDSADEQVILLQHCDLCLEVRADHADVRHVWWSTPLGGRRGGWRGGDVLREEALEALEGRLQRLRRGASRALKGFKSFEG